MKKLVLLIILFVLGSGFSFGQTTILEQYFHELKGMEDSVGVTHLFYRMFVSESVNCSDMGENISKIGKEQNHIYHFDTSTLEDSVEFRAYNSIYPDCFEEWNDTERFIFTAQHPDSTFAVKSPMGGQYGWFYFPINEEHQFGPNIWNPLGISFDKELNDLIITTPFRNLVIKAKYQDEELLRKSFRYPLKKDSVWLNYNYISDLPDSLFIDFTVIGINPYKKGHYVGIKDSNMVLSTDHGYTFKTLLQTTWKEWELDDSKFGDIHFDADSNSFYFEIDDGKFYLVKQEPDYWSIKEISKNYPSFHFTHDTHQSGSYYFSHNDSLLYSDDFGESTTLITTSLHNITGLYKKPDSNLLYVLTKKELLQLNIDTKEVTTLKKLSVSNEAEPAQIPKKITLEQNYPNPFNPSTKIQYRLPESALVRLEIFDITGRKVAVLVDGEPQSVGPHQVTFDAGNLASGMYFYRVQSGGQTITQKMMLLK